MRGLKYTTSQLLYDGVTMKMAIDQGYTIEHLPLISKLHESLITKYHSMSKQERMILRMKAQEYINERIEAITNKSTDDNDTKPTSEDT